MSEAHTTDKKTESAVDNKKHWYIIHAYSGCESQVAKALEKRIKHANLEHMFGQIVIPTEDVVEMRGGQKRKSSRKFFPGYILIEMEMNDETWYLVKHTSKVSGFVGGTAEKPAILSEKEVNAILNQVEAGESKPKPKTVYEPGEIVRVIEGPFADFNGVVEDVNYEKSRLSVSVSIFGRSTPVELEFSQVEKV
jgi:transcriptional antiterminator NusG